jgi:hypothetical protein
MPNYQYFTVKSYIKPRSDMSPIRSMMCGRNGVLYQLIAFLIFILIDLRTKSTFSCSPSPGIPTAVLMNQRHLERPLFHKACVVACLMLRLMIMHCVYGKLYLCEERELQIKYEFSNGFITFLEEGYLLSRCNFEQPVLRDSFKMF